MTTGRLIGVGVGPGDPELLTLKAARALAAADVVAHFAKQGHASNARAVVACHLRPGVEELPLLYPVTTELPTNDPDYTRTIAEFYESAAQAVARHLDAGRTVNVTLPAKMPVLLAYWTAWVDPQGRVNFRRDVYGQDALWAAGLARAYTPRKIPE